MSPQHLQIILGALDLAHRHIAQQLQQAGLAAGPDARAKLIEIEDVYAAVQAEIGPKPIESAA